MYKNQCIRLTLSTLFAFCFTYNIDACYLNGAQVVTESSRLKHWPRKTTAFLMCDSTVSMRSSTSSLQSLNLWCKPASSVQSIWGPCMYCIFWCAIFSVMILWFGSLYFWHHVNVCIYVFLSYMCIRINAFVWLYQLYSRSVSLTTLMHAISMEPRLLLKVPA